MTRPRCVPLLAVLAALTALPGGPALAQEDNNQPYYIGGGLAYRQEDNIFRVRDGLPKTDDGIASVFLLGGFDQPIGRQRVYANGRVSRYDYQDNSYLSNTAYGVAAGLDWSTIERFSGDLKVSADQMLARFSPDDGLSTSERNIQNMHAVSATVRMGLVTQLSASLGLSHRELSYSAEEFDSREFKQDNISLGGRYRFSGLLTTGLAYRYTDATYPKSAIDGSGNFRADDVTGGSIDVTADWVPTGASTVHARVSFSDQDHSLKSSQSFRGTTGMVTWDWRPTGKLSFDTMLLHDTGRDSFFLDPGAAASSDSSRVSTTLQTRVNYALTSKIGLNGSVRYTDRSLAQTTAGGDIDGDDQTTGLVLGATWQPMRALELRCSVMQEERRASGELSSPYTFATYGCAAEMTFR